MSRAFRDILVGGAPSPDLCDCGSAALGNRDITAYSSKDSGPSFGYNRTKEGPMSIITPEIRQAIEQAGEQPVQLTDPETNSLYIIVRADVYERMRALCDDFDIRDAYPLMDQVAALEGWDDPSMDIYNEYQPASE